MAQRTPNQSHPTSEARSRTARHSAQQRDAKSTASLAGEQPPSGAERAHPPSSEHIAFADFLNGKWGTAIEACRYLSLSLSVLRRETRRGRIKAYVIGGRKLIRYRRSDLDNYIEAQQVAVPRKVRR